MSNKRPLVSIVTATYNYAHFIPMTLESIRQQTYDNWESIIVDDGSTDRTEEAVRPFLTDPRFKYIRTTNRGQPAAENTGIKVSHGELLAFIDADDVWMPEKLDKQVALMQSKPNVGLVYTGRITIDSDGRTIPRQTRQFYRGRVLNEMFLNNFVTFSSSMLRREVFDKCGTFREIRRHASDYDLWLRVAQHFDFDYVDEPLVKYRTGHANLTSNGSRQLETALEIMDEFCQLHPDLLPRKLVSQAYSETFCSYGYSIRKVDAMKALGLYFRALWEEPISVTPWRGIFATSAIRLQRLFRIHK